MSKKVTITESGLSNLIVELLSEVFKSPRLKQIAKDNGGVEILNHNGLRGPNAVFKHGEPIPASELTDDMIGNEITGSDGNNSIWFNNGKRFALKNIEDVPYIKPNYRWEETPTNQGFSGVANLQDFPNINDKQTPYSVGPEYTKVNGNFYRKQDDSKYGTGIGDTGDHNRKEPYIGSKTQHSAPLNMYSISDKAGDAEHRREMKKFADRLAENVIKRLYKL